MDFTNIAKTIDNGNGDYILIILNNNYISLNYTDLLKFEGYEIFGTNVLTFNSIYSENTLLNNLKNVGMTRGIDFILWCKVFSNKIIPNSCAMII